MARRRNPYMSADSLEHLTDAELRARTGEACRRHIERYDPREWAAGVVAAVESDPSKG